jgi:hypothetical protein
LKENNNVGTYSRTVTTDPANAGLLNHLVDRYVLPVLNRNIAQAGMRRKTGSRMTPEQELQAILNFGMPEQRRVPRRQGPTTKNVAQGGLNAKDLRNLERILELGSNRKRK